MRRLAPCLLAGAVALVGTSCDQDDDAEPPPPPTTSQPQPEPQPPERRGVVLSLDRDSPHPGETLTLTVENRTHTRLEYGLPYRLERREGDDWRWINRDAAFALILMIVEPGKREREDIRLPDDLRPDRYRIVKSFTAPATGREIEVAVKFTVSGA